MLKQIIEKIKKLPELDKKRLAALIGLLLMYSLVTFFFIYFIKNKIIRLPFHRVTSVPEAYMSVAKYLIYFIIFISSMVWLKYAEMPVKEFFSRGKYTLIFYIGLFASIAYAIYCFTGNDFEYHPLVFFPPVIILSVLNSFAEEIFYRLGLYRLLRNFISSVHAANIVQAACYSFVHFYLGGLQLALPGFFYGLLMGYIFEKSESLIPSVICHFCVDLGVIGLPMMILRY